MPPADPITIPDKIAHAVDTLHDTPPEETRKKLIFLVNELIKNDFNALVQLLYRIDIDEKNLAQRLKPGSGDDTASMIADLIISRQLQKIASKKQYGDKEKPGTGDHW